YISTWSIPRSCTALVRGATAISVSIVAMLRLRWCEHAPPRSPPAHGSLPVPLLPVVRLPAPETRSAPWPQPFRARAPGEVPLGRSPRVGVGALPRGRVVLVFQGSRPAGLAGAPVKGRRHAAARPAGA
ncbi:MAG TPA: hypothetical protein VF771_05200, partial [Longimicrobiaceae bacterium]